MKSSLRPSVAFLAGCSEHRLSTAGCVQGGATTAAHCISVATLFMWHCQCAVVQQCTPVDAMAEQPCTCAQGLIKHEQQPVSGLAWFWQT